MKPVRPLYRSAERTPKPADLSAPSPAVLAYLEDCACWQAARWVTARGGDLEDATQAACLAVYEAEARFERGKGKFGSYATGCILAALREYARSQDHLSQSLRKKLRVQGETVPECWRSPLALDSSPSFELMPDPAPGPEATVVEREFERRAWAGLAHLADRERAVLVLRYEDGLSYRQIGARLGLSEATAFNIHRRGLAQLREHVTA